MSEILLKCIETLNIIQFLGIGVMFWGFYKILDKRFEAIDKRFESIDKRFESIDKRFEKIENVLEKIKDDIKELRTSLNRMEGAFYSKDCCMLKEEKQGEDSLA